MSNETPASREPVPEQWMPSPQFLHHLHCQVEHRRQRIEEVDKDIAQHRRRLQELEDFRMDHVEEMEFYKIARAHHLAVRAAAAQTSESPGALDAAVELGAADVDPDGSGIDLGDGPPTVIHAPSDDLVQSIEEDPFK